MSTFVPKELFGIIGYPINHSLSPLMHNTGFQTLDYPGVFMLWNVKPELLKEFVSSMKMLNIRGCSVGIPHKAGIVPHLDKASERVKKIGACNTLYWEDDKLCGENTDILGFLTPLEKENLGPNTKALILGAGGAGRAVVAGLKMRGVDNITIVDVVDELPDALAKEFDLKRTGWEDRLKVDADVVVNVTPLGMAGKFQGQSPYSLEAFRKNGTGLAYDVVYSPAVTRFQAEAQEAGWRVIGGQTMFFAQGNHQFRLWTGKDMPEAAFEAIRQHLAAQG